MKIQAKTIALITLIGFSISTQIKSQCGSWDKYPAGEEEAKKQHVIYRDKLKEKKYSDAYPIWEALFQTVKIPTPAKSTHFTDGIDMCFHFAKEEKDAVKKTEWIEKAIALYDQSAACNGEDALNRAYQGYYLYANGYDVVKTIKVFEKSMEIGKESPPSMNLLYMPTIAIYLYKSKVAGYDAEYLRSLYEKLKKIANQNIEKNKDAANFKKNLEEMEKQYTAVPEIFGCDYWTTKYSAIYKSVFENADTLKVMATKLADKCGKESELYKEIWAKYRSLNLGKEIARQKEITIADSSTIFSKIQAYRALAELDTAESAAYKEKVNTLIPELANSKKEWLDDKTKGTEIYRYAFSLYREGSFSNARTYCRLASKLRPDWGDPYILVGTMYASSGGRCSPATNGTGFDAQVCVWPAIDEWVKAKNVDPSSAEEANRLIGKYSGYMPSKSDLLQRGINEGSTFVVPCWIQQSTSARGI